MLILIITITPQQFKKKELLINWLKKKTTYIIIKMPNLNKDQKQIINIDAESEEKFVIFVWSVVFKDLNMTG